MSQSPFVSIIVPVYNAENYLHECLESLIGQTLPGIEIIAINDGSTDSSPEIINKYAERDGRIKVIHKPNEGHGKTVNVGMEQARGEYIGTVDADDFVDHEMYAKLYARAKEVDADVVKCWFYHYVGEQKTNTKDARCLQIKAPKLSFNIMECPDLIRMHASVWSAIYKRSFIEEHNIRWIETPKSEWIDNPFRYATLISAERIALVEDFLYHYRVDVSESATKTTNYLVPLARWVENIDILENFPEKKLLLDDFSYIEEFSHVLRSFKLAGLENIGDALGRTITSAKRRNASSILNSRLLSVVQKAFFEALIAEDFSVFVRRIEGHINTLSSHHNELRRTNDKLLKEHNKLTGEHNKLTGEHDKLIAEHKRLTASLAAIKHSLSWKITAPFRKLKRIMKNTGRAFWKRH